MQFSERADLRFSAESIRLHSKGKVTMALYRKWRPASFDEVVGQEHVIRTLRNAISSGRVHHAYLFAGPRGTGKTTTARLLAKAVNCLAPEDQRPCNRCSICEAIQEGRLLDLVEIDAASNTSVEDVRDLRERVGFRPTEARYKVYVIDEVHMLSTAAFNALLKTLEEPPPHTIFILATTEVHRIPPTVLSRCQRFDFRRLALAQIVARLRWLAEQECIQVEDEALVLIARQATGSMRDAESLLDQIASYREGRITAEDVRAALGIGADTLVTRIVEALRLRDVASGLQTINAAIEEGADPRRFARQIVEHLRALLLLQLGSGAPPIYVADELRPQLEAQASGFVPQQLVRALRLFNEVASATTVSWQIQLPLELAFVEAALHSMELPIAHTSGAGSPSTPTARSVQAPVSASLSAPLAHSEAAGARAEGSQTVLDGHLPYPTAGAADSPVTLEVLRERWTDFLNVLRPRNLPLEALVRSGTPVAVEDEVVVLGFAHDLHRCKAEEERNKRDIEDALAELLGRRCRVRCVLTPRGHAGAPASAKAFTSPSAGSENPNAAETSEDPLISAAMELGAQVVYPPDQIT